MLESPVLVVFLVDDLLLLRNKESQAIKRRTNPETVALWNKRESRSLGRSQCMLGLRLPTESQGNSHVFVVGDLVSETGEIHALGIHASRDGDGFCDTEVGGVWLESEAVEDEDGRDGRRRMSLTPATVVAASEQCPYVLGYVRALGQLYDSVLDDEAEAEVWLYLVGRRWIGGNLFHGERCTRFLCRRGRRRRRGGY